MSLSEQYDVKFEMYRDNPVCVGILRKVEDAIIHGRVAEAQSLLELLPSREELMTKLSDHLKGKSIEKTLKDIKAGKVTNKYTQLKALFSIGTHIAIECEKGDEKFSALFDGVLNRIAILVATKDGK